MAGKSIEVLRVDYAAAIVSGSEAEFLAAKTALVEATTGRTLTADRPPDAQRICL